MRMRLLAGMAVLAVAAGGCTDTGGDTDGEATAEPEASSTLVAFDPEAGEFSEGVTVDADGNVYASLSPLGRLVRIDADSGTAEDVGMVEGLGEGDLGLLGLDVDDDGNVYGVVMSADNALRGAWRFDPGTGEAERLPGTEQIAFPNAVVVDDGTLYISDTSGADGRGAVWRVRAEGEAEIWAQSDLLAGDGSAGFGAPLGPNGIDVHDGTVYVGLTEPAAIAAIPIAEDGSSGEVTIFADLKTSGPEDAPIVVDGIAVDDDGRVYVAAPTIHEVLLVAADGADVDTVASASDGLDAPSSVVIGNGVLYVANFSAALAAFTNETGPSIVQVPL